MATENKGKTLGLTKATGDVTPMLSNIAPGMWVSTSGVTVKKVKTDQGTDMELRVGYDFNGMSNDQIIILACRALDIDMQRRVRDAYKADKDGVVSQEKIKTITDMCKNSIKVAELSKGERNRLSPADKLRKMFPNLKDEQIVQMLKAGAL